MSSPACALRTPGVGGDERQPVTMTLSRGKAATWQLLSPDSGVASRVERCDANGPEDAVARVV